MSVVAYENRNVPATGAPTFKMRVYLAGPIKKNDWRHLLVPGLRDAFDGDNQQRAQFDTELELMTITPGLVCVGPWFISCDHGCAHGPGQHGAFGTCMGETIVGANDPRSMVFDANINRIRRADAVFGYIDRRDAYGTMFELGLAWNLCKPVFLGFPVDAPWRDDMWFSEQAALRSRGCVNGSVEDAWAEFCRRAIADSAPLTKPASRLR